MQKCIQKKFEFQHKKRAKLVKEIVTNKMAYTHKKKVHTLKTSMYLHQVNFSKGGRKKTA